MGSTPIYSIPFADPTDLVRDWPALSEDVAEQVALGLDAAGGLVAVKFVVKTNIQATSVAANAQTLVTGLEISHAVSDPSNRVILWANVLQSWAANDNNDTTLSIYADGVELSRGDAAGSRQRRAKFGRAAGSALGAIPQNHVEEFEPMTTDSVDYEVRAGHFATSTQTIYINRSNADTDNATGVRGVSTLMLMEVKV